MHTETTRGVLVVFWMLLLTGVLGACASTTRMADPDPETSARMVDSIGAILRSRAYAEGVDFSRWPRFVQMHRARIDGAEEPNDLLGALNDALGEFGVSHIGVHPVSGSHKYTPTAVDPLVFTSFERVEEGLRALWIPRHSPARDMFDLRAGDILVELNGVDPTVKPETVPHLPFWIPGVFHALIDGQRGIVHICAFKNTVVTIRDGQRLERMIEHGRGPERVEWMLRKPRHERTDAGNDLVIIPSFDLELLDPGLLPDLRASRGLILDLRSNRGGTVFRARQLLERLIPRGRVLWSETTTSGARGQRWMPLGWSRVEGARPNLVGREIKSCHRPNLAPSAPVVVLTDRASASGAEFVAAVLREQLDAVVIGEPTAGKVVGSRASVLRGGVTLRYPVRELRTAGGVRLEGAPLVPDIVLTPEELDDERALLALCDRVLAERRAD